ncbi:MAG: MerR family transcriptional regulator [Candidatus Promineifilaceae bacterium]
MKASTSLTTGVNTPVFNLKAVVMETGLKPPTIRAWERRYGMPKPARTAGGHRQYSQHDIDLLNWLVARQEEGMSISHAVELWQTLEAQGLDPLLQQEQPGPIHLAVSPDLELGSEILELQEAWLAACLAFDRRAAEQTLARAFALFSPEVVSIEILQSTLSKVGKLWLDGEITVQQEHFTSVISSQRLAMLIASAPEPIRPQRIVVAAAEDEQHFFGALLITYLLRRRGWDVLYLGADVPVAQLAEMVEEINPQMVIVAAQRLATAGSVVEIADALADCNTVVAYGGRIFNTQPELRQRIPAFFLGPTIAGAVDEVEKLILQDQAPPTAVRAEAEFSEALDQFRQRRSLIESHVWDTFAAEGRPTNYLPDLFEELGAVIEAALSFGDSDLLSSETAWADYLMASYHLSPEEYEAFTRAYYQAASTQLSGSLQFVVNWLQTLVTS